MLLDRMVATKTIRIECNKADDIDENEEGENWHESRHLLHNQSDCDGDMMTKGMMIMKINYEKEN